MNYTKSEALSNLRKFIKSSVYNNIITCQFQISKKVHKNQLLYTLDEANLQQGTVYPPPWCALVKVAARHLALRNR